jgi:hypothetical protein
MEEKQTWKKHGPPAMPQKEQMADDTRPPKTRNLSGRGIRAIALW